MAEVEQRLTDVESEQAKFRDDTDEILLSEIMERLQQVTHTLEDMSNKIEGLSNRIQTTNRLLLAIGAVVVVILLERLL